MTSAKRRKKMQHQLHSKRPPESYRSSGFQQTRAVTRRNVLANKTLGAYKLSGA